MAPRARHDVLPTALSLLAAKMDSIPDFRRCREPEDVVHWLVGVSGKAHPGYDRRGRHYQDHHQAISNEHAPRTRSTDISERMGRKGRQTTDYCIRREKVKRDSLFSPPTALKELLHRQSRLQEEKAPHT